jgi:RNA polymerase sigma-70 factor (ECF subfamily)
VKSPADDPLSPKFFPHAYGRLVSLLAGRLGDRELGRIEDAVQTAMLRAVEGWRRGSVPDNPQAWLYRVAYNECLQGRRREGKQRAILERHPPSEDERVEQQLPADCDDAIVRMLLVCCQKSLSTKASLVLALKILCGLGVPEIARRLFESEDNVYKIYQRGRATLARRSKVILDVDEAQFTRRLPSLCRVLYALFCEGYNSLAGEVAVRIDLCAEAIRLATLVAGNRQERDPSLCALLALMHFGAARLPGRIGPSGELLLLAEQDRSKWDQMHIATGLGWLAKSAAGSTFSRYHAEAGVAAEHCIASSLSATNWSKIVDCYDLLFQFEEAPSNRLDWVVAIAELRGAAEGMQALKALDLPAEVRRSYLRLAVAGTLERRLGNYAAAHKLELAASSAAPTPLSQSLIERRLQGSELLGGCGSGKLPSANSTGLA